MYYFTSSRPVNKIISTICLAILTQFRNILDGHLSRTAASISSFALMNECITVKGGGNDGFSSSYRERTATNYTMID